MTARALIKSPTAQRSSPSLTSPGASMPQLPNQSVQADGMRDRLPSGSTTNNNGTPRRVRPLITARRHPWKGCRLRVMTTEVGRSWEWVVCGVFVRGGHIVAVEELTGRSDEEVIVEARVLFSEREKCVEGFEVWDQTRAIVRHPSIARSEPAWAGGGPAAIEGEAQWHVVLMPSR